MEAFTTKMARWPAARDLVAALAAAGLAPEGPSTPAAVRGRSGKARAVGVERDAQERGHVPRDGDMIVGTRIAAGGISRRPRPDTP